jgi:serine/threonine-protein kinase
MLPQSRATVMKKCPRCRKTYDNGGQFCPDDGAPLSASTLLEPGVAAALASDYRILDFLGSGGMGSVFLAEQIRVGNRKVALKILHRKFSEDDEFIGRFENEAASTGRINHPNVITIYESKQAPDGTLYIAMELVEGESLTEHLRKRGRLPLVDAVEIVTQCCKALYAAHRLGIIHRDIKPDNIMLAKDIDGGVLVKILDFGIAKLKDSTGHTVTGSVLGTPAYMSYEQASGLSSDKLDGRSDIYSLGIVAYTALTGQTPFRADTPVGYITKHLTESPAPLRSLRPELPAGVDAAVMKALDKNRELRFQAAMDFATAMREAGRTVAPMPTPAPAVETTTPPWKAMRPAGSSHTTEVGIGALPRPAVTPGPSTRETPTRPPAAPLTPVPITPAPAPRPAPPPRAPTPVQPPAPERAPVVHPAPAPAPVVHEAPKATPSRRPAPAVSEAPPAERRESGDGEGVAAALWGVRTLISWGITAYAALLLALFAWPLLAPLVGPATFFSSVAIVQPVVQWIGQFLPDLRFGDWDPLPAVLAVLLLLLRPRITNPLWRLEARYRARAGAVSGEALG